MYSVPTKTNAKKLPPSSSPATFAPASVRSRKIDSGSIGDAHAVLDHQERDEQRGGGREHRDRPRGAPAVLRRLGDRVDEQHQPAGAGDRAGHVEPPARRRQPALGDEPRRQQRARPPRSGR